MGEINGSVALTELSNDRIFIDLEKNDKNNIRNRIKRSYKFSSILKEYSLIDWYYGKTELIRLDRFQKISKLFNISNLKIKAIRTKQGLSIEHPKSTFNFANKDGVRLIACILGDGCMHQKGVRYNNSNQKLIANFIKYCQATFGQVIYKTYHGKNNVIIISLPLIYEQILETVGLRISTRQSKCKRIPNFISNLAEKYKFEFISQLIDDDGYIGKDSISIDQGFNLNEEPLLLHDVQKLLNTLNIKSSVFPASRYESKTGAERQMWRLLIHSSRDVRRLASNLKLNINYKCKDAQKLSKLIKQGRYENTNSYMPLIRDLSNNNKDFTVIDLMKASNRSLRQCRRIMNNLKKSGYVEVVQPPCRGHCKIEYASYRVIK